jgi:hypothetical protein
MMLCEDMAQEGGDDDTEKSNKESPMLEDSSAVSSDFGDEEPR